MSEKMRKSNRMSVLKKRVPPIRVIRNSFLLRLEDSKGKGDTVSFAF